MTTTSTWPPRDRDSLDLVIEDAYAAYIARKVAADEAKPRMKDVWVGKWVPNTGRGPRCQHGAFSPNGRAECHDCYCASGCHVNFSRDGQWVRNYYKIQVEEKQKTTEDRMIWVLLGWLLAPISLPIHLIIKLVKSYRAYEPETTL